MDDEEKYAVFAEASYRYKDELDGKLQKGYTNKLLHEHYGLYEYSIDESLSDRNSIVIIGEDAIISYRGTDPAESSDLVADFHILTGASHLPQSVAPERFKLATDKYNATKAAYADKEIKTTGHSLGAHQSLMVARKYGLEGHHYNAGSSVADALIQTTNFLKCNIVDCPTAEKQYLYTTGNDPISILMLPRMTEMFGKENVTFKRKEGLDMINHSLGHFLPDVNFKSPLYKNEKELDPIKHHILHLRFANDADSDVLYMDYKKRRYRRRHTHSDSKLKWR